MLIKRLAVCALLFAPLLSQAKPLATCTLFFNPPKLSHTFSKPIILNHVPVARTEAEMNIGLSKRKEVKNGMLFSWPTAETRIFWMRDTWVDLSVGFFDADGVLFQIKHMKNNSLQYHTSSKKAKTALELAQGQFEILGLKVGSQLMEQQCQTIDD